MLPVTRIPAVLVLSLFSLVHIHARHTTIHPGVQGLSDTKTSYKYIDKLSLSNDNRREIQEILLDAGAQHEKLLAEYQAETYRPLTIGKRYLSSLLIAINSYAWSCVSNFFWALFQTSSWALAYRLQALSTGPNFMALLTAEFCAYPHSPLTCKRRISALAL